jgi:hypothetical protein
MAQHDAHVGDWATYWKAILETAKAKGTAGQPTTSEKIGWVALSAGLLVLMGLFVWYLSK